MAGIANQEVSDISEAQALKEIGIDSIGMIDLIGGLEVEFGIRVADEDVGPEVFADMGSLAGYIERKSNKS